MIVDQRYVDYINSLEKELPPYLEELEQYALQTEVPIIRKEMQSFLKTNILKHSATTLVLLYPKRIPSAPMQCCSPILQMQGETTLPATSEQAAE